MAAAGQSETSSLRVDVRRERELYRYFQPPLGSSATLNAHQASSPDTSLTALAQLCAIRLNAQRAMISVIDEHNQYFIAEATRTLDLSDTTALSGKEDGLWFGCGMVDKSGRLCEKTIELPRSHNSFPCFTVNDLSKDERFKQLPFVTGPPYFKFYAGTPLTTKRGVNIGSLFIIDDVVRERLSKEQEHLMGTISQTVMHHLELAREAQDRRKMMRMSSGLNAFVEGKSSIDTGQEHSSESEPSADESDVIDTAAGKDMGHHATFKRAASILLEALEIQESGGVVFLDTTSRLRTDHESSDRSPQRPVKVLAHSCGTESSNTKSFSVVDIELLSGLLSRYRHGRLWIFNQDGSLSSSEDDVMSPNETQKSMEWTADGRDPRRRSEIARLQQYFPGARQLLFSGLWDAGSSRWFSAGFAWTSSRSQVFGKETELSYFLSFGKNIMAEVSRLASMNADRQKADFIGSISHEFRSPLHGILASAEFLAETEFDTFQSSLVDTISSCGRTLLDTINHILDYSKINSFERNCRNVRRPAMKSRMPRRHRLGHGDGPPMMNIYSTIDVAKLVEEVVEGVYAGQVYQDISSTDATDFSNAAQVEAVNRGIAVQKKGKTKEIDVQMDIAYDNYVFTTQPGAFKRIIMNVFGNALKYTTTGSIRVEMFLDPQEEASDDALGERIVELRVTDTGRGISSEYIRTSLFQPFCQEDPLASGTGLGLSIVRSIVTTLNGAIDVQSEVGKGTQIKIRLPLTRLPGTDTPVSTPSSTADNNLTGDSVEALKRDYGNTSVQLIGFDDYDPHQTLTRCLTDWLGLRILASGSSIGPLASADVCILDGKGITEFSRITKKAVPTVVLCNDPSSTQTAAHDHPRSLVEYVSKPVGPYKLAKVLRSVLEKARLAKAGLTPEAGSSIAKSPAESDTDTVMPDKETSQLTLERYLEETPLEVETNGAVTASSSSNAHLAMENTTSSNGNSDVAGGPEFPFPAQDGVDEYELTGELQPHHNELPTRNGVRRPELKRREPSSPLEVPGVAESPAKEDSPLNDHPKGETPLILLPSQTQGAGGTIHHGHTENNTTSESLEPKNSVPLAIPSKVKEWVKRPPRLLLVDDNKINLRLLETFMRKRNYRLIDSAENGQLAVQAAESHDVGYDIIFMDISMPVMNGFEATRAIRDMEDNRTSGGIGKDQESNTRGPALIIALTGLASSKDQAEAFTSGVDLFITKPVSFKEVGRLLDNWEAGTDMKRHSHRSSGDTS